MTGRRRFGAVLALAIVAPFVAAGPGAAEAPELPEGPVPDREVVVLLHGLGRSSGSMADLGRYLEREGGLQVANLDYDSVTTSPGELVADLSSEIRRCCAAAPKLHFATHSLGGILARAIIAADRPANLGRVVMLAPPNQGSEIVDASPALRWLLGPTGGELGTGRDSLPNRLPSPDFELGIVAGTESINPIGSALLPDEDDGAVAIARTKLAGMTDFVTVPANHTFIMQEPEVAALVLHFIEHGRFRAEAPPLDPAAEPTGAAR